MCVIIFALIGIFIRISWHSDPLEGLNQQALEAIQMKPSPTSASPKISRQKALNDAKKRANWNGTISEYLVQLTPVHVPPNFFHSNPYPHPAWVVQYATHTVIPNEAPLNSAAILYDGIGFVVIDAITGKVMDVSEVNYAGVAVQVAMDATVARDKVSENQIRTLHNEPNHSSAQIPIIWHLQHQEERDGKWEPAKGLYSINVLQTRTAFEQSLTGSRVT